MHQINQDQGSTFHTAPGMASESTRPYHIHVAGMQVELRYKPSGPSLQQKVIALCNQSIEL